MLTGLSIRDVVLIEAVDLEPGPGLTVLTGETGGGKSIILDALGLATGARSDAGLVRTGASQASAAAIFSLPAGHPAFGLLADRGIDADPGEDIVLRRTVALDGRSRAFVNDQAASVGLLKDLGGLLLEVHGQHETVGLLDAKTHRGLLDAYGAHEAEVAAAAAAWAAWRDALSGAEAVAAEAASAQAQSETLAAHLADLDRLEPRPGEETELADTRAVLGAAEKALADIASAREALGGDTLSSRMAQAFRALERARERTIQAGAHADGAVPRLIGEAAAALDRALVEAGEAMAAIDAAADAFDFEPGRLDKAEERLFDLRAMARKLGVAVDDLAAERARIARALQAIEAVDERLAAARAEAAAAEAKFRTAAAELTEARLAAAERLQAAVMAELPALKLEKTRFRAAVSALPQGQGGAAGVDRVAFEVSTNPGAPFGPLGAIASGGELSRLALALKAALAVRGGDQPVMIFDEVDQGVGGAVADAIGLRLRGLARTGQVLVVSHSPQIAARADAHWRVGKAEGPSGFVTRVEALGSRAREEEVARMLAGAEITDAARAAARALMEA